MTDNYIQLLDDTSYRGSPDIEDVTKGNLQEELKKLREITKSACALLLETKDSLDSGCGDASKVLNSYTSEVTLAKINVIKTDLTNVYQASQISINASKDSLTPTQYIQALDILFQLSTSINLLSSLSSLYSNLFSFLQGDMDFEIGDLDGLISCLLSLCFNFLSGFMANLSNMKLFSYLTKFSNFLSLYSNFSVNNPFSLDMLFAEINPLIPGLPTTRIKKSIGILPDINFPEVPDTNLPKYAKSNLSIPMPILPQLDEVPFAPNATSVMPKDNLTFGTGTSKIAEGLKSSVATNLTSTGDKLSLKKADCLTSMTDKVTAFKSNPEFSYAMNVTQTASANSLTNLGSVFSSFSNPNFDSVVAQASSIGSTLNTKFTEVITSSNDNVDAMLEETSSTLTENVNIDNYNTEVIPTITSSVNTIEA